MKSKEMIGKKIMLGYDDAVGCSELLVCSYCGRRSFICSVINDWSWQEGALIQVSIHEKLRDDPNCVYLAWSWAPVQRR